MATINGSVFFDWLLLALSLFNCVILLWLGLTMLLNADRRRGGMLLVAGAALLGSAFFAAHTAILSIATRSFARSLDFWWKTGWLMLVALPFTWYAIVLWFGGFGDQPRVPLRRRHRLPLFAMAAVFGVLAGALVFGTPLPSFSQVVELKLNSTLSLFGLPWFLAAYPVYIIGCTALSFDALRHIGPETEAENSVARKRARPWLLATTILLVVVSVLVTTAIAWFTTLPRGGAIESSRTLVGGAVWFDLLISLLIAIVNVCIGQAMVRYEVFSGRTLPRRELRRHWGYALTLAAGYGIVVGGSLALGLRPIYGLLLSAVLMASLFALAGWRTFSRQQEFMRRLRPFVASTRLYAQLTAPADGPAAAPPGDMPLAGMSSAGTDGAGTLAALGRQVLNTDFVALVAAGPMAPLIPVPLVYPRGSPLPPITPNILPAQLTSGGTTCAPLQVDGAPQVAWAVPLWSERGLIGVLLLGSQRDGGLYTQEEIEIAQATGERLIDLQAGTALAQRLLTVERERLTESIVLDRQTRRVLHDDVLPELHTALLMLNRGAEGDIADASAMLTTAHRRIAGLLRAMPVRPALRPAGSLLVELRQLVEVEMAGHFDAVRWQEAPEVADAAASLSPVAAEVTYYAVREVIRNAARHGRGGQELRPLELAVDVSTADGLSIVVQDNGVGTVLAAASDSHGQGLALHTAMLALVGGTLSVESIPGSQTRVTLWVPVERAR